MNKQIKPGRIRPTLPGLASNRRPLPRVSFGIS
jgi:hypothetical protein